MNGSWKTTGNRGRQKRNAVGVGLRKGEINLKEAEEQDVHVPIKW